MSFTAVQERSQAIGQEALIAVAKAFQETVKAVAFGEQVSDVTYDDGNGVRKTMVIGSAWGAEKAKISYRTSDRDGASLVVMTPKGTVQISAGANKQEVESGLQEAFEFVNQSLPGINMSPVETTVQQVLAL